MKDIIPIEKIRERDIDLLLLEELSVNIEFRRWFVERASNVKQDFEFSGVWHSLSKVGLGETDICLKIRTREGIEMFLIENKIDSSFRNDQATRYRQRGQLRKEAGECNHFTTVLIAPQAYMSDFDGFDAGISYEVLKEGITQSKGIGQRRKDYKLNLLDLAILKKKRGYNAIIDEKSTKFWWAYYNYVSENHSALEMRKPPGGVPKGSGFVTFEPAIAKKYSAKLIHKIGGCIDFQMAGRADELVSFQMKYDAKLNFGMSIERAGKSLSIRYETTPVSNQRTFESQYDSIADAIHKGTMLLNWVRANFE